MVVRPESSPFINIYNDAFIMGVSIDIVKATTRVAPRPNKLIVQKVPIRLPREIGAVGEPFIIIIIIIKSGAK
jgi:hypothetical protein